MLQAVHSSLGLDVRDGNGHTLVGFPFNPENRPYLHPITVPGTGSVLTEDAPPHHPWQHGLYIGLNAVNGLDFWCEGKAGLSPEVTGRFRSSPASLVVSDHDTTDVTLCVDYLTPTGDCILKESQSWRVALADNRLVLDLSWTLHAEIAVHFGRYDYGGLFLRMPYRSEHGGEVENSEGATGENCEGAPARWVRVRMPLAPDNVPHGFILMDHPLNPGHPVPWRVDYQLGVGPGRCIAGEWKLAPGEECLQRYRLVSCDNFLDNAGAETLWRNYAL